MSRPELKTHCVDLIAYLKFRFSGETHQKRPEIDGIAKQTQDNLTAKVLGPKTSETSVVNK